MTSLRSFPDAVRAPAKSSHPFGIKTIFLLASVLTLTAGCSVIDKPARAAMYDFGPGGLASQAVATTAMPAPAVPLPALALALADITTSGGALENQALLYRLGYLDNQQLRAYSQARWTMPPAQLVRQRLRERLGQQRVVLNAREGVALNRSQNANMPMLRLELEEFSQVFSAPDASVGLVRLHATLVEITPAGERLVAQRSLAVQQPATSPDAAGGVRALTAATDTAVDELDGWLRQAAVR